jgi:hypothetical protein
MSSPFTVHRSPFAVRRSPFAVRGSPFTVRRSPFAGEVARAQVPRSEVDWHPISDFLILNS